MSNQDGSAAPQGNPIITYYNEWADRTPFVTRNSLIGIVIVYILSWFIEADRQLGNMPYFTVMNFEFYRIITSPIVGNSIFSILMIFLFFPQMGGRLESSIGSTGYLWLMVSLSLVINILFVGTCYLLYVLGMPDAIFWNCSGFWNIIFAFITIECMQIPDMPRQLMFIPVDIPSKYFPLILYAFFSLFSGPQLDLFISLAVGYLYSKGAFDKLRLSSYYLEGLEAPGGLFHGVSRYRGWALAAGTGHDSWIPVNGNDPDVQTRHGNGASSGPTAGFPNIGGFSSLRTDDDEETGTKKDTTPFPGSGHKLASNTSALSSVYSTAGIGSSTNQVSKEVIAQRRLAALGALNANNQQPTPEKK